MRPEADGDRDDDLSAVDPPDAGKLNAPRDASDSRGAAPGSPSNPDVLPPEPVRDSAAGGSHGTEPAQRVGPRTCGAKRRGGGRCGSTALCPNGRCRLHGGRGGRPIKHGRYSQSLGRLAKAYEEARRDPTLFDLAEPIAILDALSKRAMERAADLDTPGFRKRALELFDAFRAATAAGDAAVGAARLNELSTLLRTGCAEDEALAEMGEHVDRLARRIEGAWSVKLAKKNVVNTRDLLAIMMRMLDVVQTELRVDDNAMRRVATAMDGVLELAARRN